MVKDKKKKKTAARLPHASRTPIRDVVVMSNDVIILHLGVFGIFWKSFFEVFSGEQEKESIIRVRMG